jgi:hypothetical protein
VANVTWTSLLLWQWERMMSLKVRGKAPSREDRLLPRTHHTRGSTNVAVTRYRW